MNEITTTIISLDIIAFIISIISVTATFIINRKLETIKALNESKVHMGKIQFDFEVQIYEELMRKIIEFQDNLYPFAHYAHFIAISKNDPKRDYGLFKILTLYSNLKDYLQIKAIFMDTNIHRLFLNQLETADEIYLWMSSILIISKNENEYNEFLDKYNEQRYKFANNIVTLGNEVRNYLHSLKI